MLRASGTCCLRCTDLDGCKSHATGHMGDEASRLGQAQAGEARREGHVDAAAIRAATHAVQSGTGHAVTQIGNFQHDAIAGAGHLAGTGLDASGQFVEGTSRHAPTVGAAAGAWLGADAAVAMDEFRQLSASVWSCRLARPGQGSWRRSRRTASDARDGIAQHGQPHRACRAARPRKVATRAGAFDPGPIRRVTAPR